MITVTKCAVCKNFKKNLLACVRMTVDSGVYECMQTGDFVKIMIFWQVFAAKI